MCENVADIMCEDNVSDDMCEDGGDKECEDVVVGVAVAAALMYEDVENNECEGAVKQEVIHVLDIGTGM